MEVNVQKGNISIAKSAALAAIAGLLLSLSAHAQGGAYLYVTNGTSNNVSAFTIDPSTGALGPVPGSPFPPGPFLGRLPSIHQASSPI